MKKVFSAASIFVALMAMPSLLVAHPGHGHENPLSPGHYVANPEHVLPLALTATVAILVGVMLRRAASKPNKK